MKKVLTTLAVLIMIASISISLKPVIAQELQYEHTEANSRLSSLEKIQKAYDTGKIDYEDYLLLKYYAIFKPEKLPNEYKQTMSVTPTKSATPLILKIRENWNKLSPRIQEQLSFVFKRPTDVGGGPDNRQHILPQLYYNPGGHFVIHWTNGSDGGLAADASH